MGTGTKININLEVHLKGHNSGIYALTKHDEHSFYSCAADGWIAKWTPSESEDGELIAQCNEPLYCLNYVNQNIYAGSSNGFIFIITPDKEVRKIEAHTRGVFFIQASKNEFISGGGDGKLMVWNKEMELQKVIQLSHQSLRAALVLEDEIIIAGSEGKLFFLNHTYESQHSIKAQSNSLFALAHIKDTLYSGGRNAELRIWKNRQLQKYIPAHLLHIHGLAANPNGALLASTSMDKSCKIWSEDGELLKVLDAEKFGGHINSVNACLWLNESTLVTGSDDRTIMVYSLDAV